MEKYISKIEKEFDECWYRDDIKIGLYEGKIDKEWFKSFLKQSFIKYLQSEVERLEKSKKEKPSDKAYVYTGIEVDRYNQAISDQITHITNQIKGLEV